MPTFSTFKNMRKQKSPQEILEDLPAHRKHVERLKKKGMSEEYLKEYDLKFSPLYKARKRRQEMKEEK